MLVKNAYFLDWLAATQQSSQNLRSLLESDHYDQVAEQLGLLLPLDDPTANLILTHTALVMRSMCQSLHQCQREADWHAWAIQNVHTRQAELRAGLYAILELADEVVRMNSDKAPQPVRIAPGQMMHFPARDGYLSQSDGAVNSVRRFLRRGDSHQRAVHPTPQPHAEYDLVVHTLGGFQVCVRDTLVEDWSSRKGAAIFKYLLLNRERPVHKEKLLEVIWSEANDTATLDRLNGAIYSLRQALRRGSSKDRIIFFENDHYRLNPELRIWVDSEEFSRRCQLARQAEQQGKPKAAVAEYEAAVMLYRGPLFAEYPFLEWVEYERQRLQSGYLAALDKLGDYHLAQHDYLACHSTCQRMLEVEPASERAHARLMRMYVRSGQTQLAQQQYQMCLVALRSQGLCPSEEITALYAHIRNAQAI
jgi:DNA-binding SARP family transcriptional activator